MGRSDDVILEMCSEFGGGEQCLYSWAKPVVELLTFWNCVTFALLGSGDICSPTWFFFMTGSVCTFGVCCWRQYLWEEFTCTFNMLSLNVGPSLRSSMLSNVMIWTVVIIWSSMLSYVMIQTVVIISVYCCEISHKASRSVHNPYHWSLLPCKHFSTKVIILCFFTSQSSKVNHILMLVFPIAFVICLCRRHTDKIGDNQRRSGRLMALMSVIAYFAFSQESTEPSLSKENEISSLISFQSKRAKTSVRSYFANFPISNKSATLTGKCRAEPH